ncbi:MAG: DUF421 domain-containing protein [Bacillaceae bacterium]|nr:DUF421 domain-containing protein [Bacillaceae bacterium]
MFMYMKVTTELILGFIALFLITKILGKTQVSQVTPFDFISAIVLGEILGNALYDDSATGLLLLYSLFIWGCLMLLVKLISQKSNKMRKWIEGNPSILIRQGKIDREQLKKNRLNLHHLLYMLRQANVFSVREVEYAIIEPDGRLSVMKKPDYDSVKAKDMYLPVQSSPLPTTLIADGRLIEENLHALGYDHHWLKQQLETKGVTRVEDVFYAEWKADEGIFVVEQNER